MPTIERARKIKKGMGINYVICWDAQWSCYRVLEESDPRVNYTLPRV
jgi:hypothetical protein